ncbi:hypothetical protein JL720_16542 [Aureococcus anophagefferens]|nr:hypothetical protein JL720_16542 [Aureococcus anophagefferens]
MSMLWTATVAVLAAAAGAVVVAPPQTTLKAPTQVPSLPQSYESPALEPILLDRSSSLEEKIGGIKAHYETRPWLVARRLASISAAALRSYGAWARGSPDDFDEFAAARARPRPASPAGAVLRDEISKLGVVFVKLAQTMATRPDIIGEEARRASSLQAATVYRGETAGGAAVAIKVRRPGVVDQVALDTYAVRVMLKALQEFWGTNSTDYPAIVNEVTAGLFRELDFREASSAVLGRRPLAGYLRVPGRATPGATRGLVRDAAGPRRGVDRRRAGAISARQRDGAKGLDVCFLQLFGTGFVHADPHYGNMMYDRDDNLVLLDFGLVTNLTVPQTEAMATAVTAILNEDWPTLLDSFRDIGLVPPEPAIWVDAKTGSPSAGSCPARGAGARGRSSPRRSSEALEGGGDRALAGSFTEITARLTELALTYQFILPPWLLFVAGAGDDAANVAARVAALLLADADGALRRRGTPSGAARGQRCAVARAAFGRAAPAPLRDAARAARGAPAALLRRLPASPAAARRRRAAAPPAPAGRGTPKMLKPQTRCSRKLQEYLQDLARREDLELLRAPLREHDLFPPDKDGATAAITGEELKKLVRHWKLHEARGFWKMHPQKEDLVYALLEYMEDKEEYNRKGPTRPPSSKPTKEPPKVKARRQSQVDLATFRVSVLKPYGGDLFSQRDHTQGLIYLSRQNLRGGAGAGGKVQAQKSSQRNRHNSFLTGDFLGVGGGAGGKESGGGETPEEQQAAERMRERWQAIIVEIFRYSTTPGDEDIIGEALHVIDKIGKTEQAAASLTDLKMATYCAATLANLTTERAVHGVLMPPQQMVVAEALSLMSTHHATEPTVMLLSCLILGHLSGHYGGEDALIATCLSTLASGIAVDSAACRKVALVALANLLTSAGGTSSWSTSCRPSSTSRRSRSTRPRSSCSRRRTTSFFDMPRAARGRHHRPRVLAALPGPAPRRQGRRRRRRHRRRGPARRRRGAPHARGVLLNLTCTVDGRERMIKDGAVKTLVDLEQMTTAKQSKEVIGLAVANLTGAEVSHMLPTVLAHGAVPTRVATRRPSSRAGPFGSHVALKKLSDGEATTSSVQVLVLVAYINLLSVPENQCEIVEAGVLELLKRLTADPAVSPEVRRYVGMALANIADDLSRHNSSTHTDVLAMMTLLATNSGIELQRIIASAFAMFAHIMTVRDEAGASPADRAKEDMLLTDDVVNTIITLCAMKDTVVLKFAGIALNNLSQECAYHDVLLRNSITNAQHLAESREDEVRRMCASTVRALTASDELRAAETSTVKGFIRVLGALDTSRAADIINFTAAALFSISCIRQHSGLLTSDSSILWRLFGMMRGGQESTQLYGGALCNLTCEENAKLVNDASAHRPQRDNEKGGRGIVKVLRSLLEADLAPKVALEVKVKCTLALYNMAMCSPEVSERLVDDGVTVLLEALLASDNPLVLELALVVCYNISLVPGCDVAMVGYQIGSSLMKLLEGLTPDDAGAMHKLHPAWLTDEIEPMMKLLSGDHGAPKPSAARLDDAAACLYNLLTVGGTDLHAADNLSALLTALFKRVDKPQTRSLCAAALIARQGDQEGAHYSDGSVVALFSAMQSEVSGYDAAAAASPTKMKTDKRQISPGVDDDDAHGHHDTLSYFFSKVDAGTCSPSTIRSRQVDRDKIVVEPMWMHFEQDSHVVSEGLEAPPTQSLKLPKQPADPPRTMYTKSSGRFRKIILFPNKVKAENDAHHSIKDDDATWGDHGSQFEIVTTFDFGQVYPPLAA